MTTLSFLASGDQSSLERIRTAFRRYRQAIVAGSNASSEAAELRHTLIPFMSRSERPRLEEGRDLLVRRVESRVPAPEDLQGYAALQAFAREVDSPVSLDYWKSIPYFASFMDGYRPGERARMQFETGTATAELRSSIGQLRSVDARAIRCYEAIDYGNERLRHSPRRQSSTTGGSYCGFRHRCRI